MPRVLILAAALALARPGAAADLGTLKSGDTLHGFRVTTVYLDASDRPLGARFMHPATGFQLDLMQIESVPQAFTWVKSFATGDQGEPHTQEHLLLLRGVAGRTFATKLSMSLVTQSAYTETWRTSYFFNTSAGIDTFFDIYAEQQHAMLHPDYSDAEIRLEVRNFGVTRNADGTLRLEEKGPVYNEMVASMATASGQVWRAHNHVVYGERHPLAYNQGGEPAAIRTMTPKDIRAFHRASHHLANMGTIAAFPKSASLDTVLARFDAILMKDAPAGGKPRRADDPRRFPRPNGDPEGATRIYEYPHSNEEQPSPLEVVWPATRNLDAGEQLLAELFFANVAGDATTNLYKLFIDGRTRRMDIGASSVGATVGEWGGHPISIEFADVRPASMSSESMKAIRALVVDEVKRVAAFGNASAELRQFNDRIASRVIEREREAAKFIGTPPRFGARNGSSAWPDLLMRLETSPGTRKSLVMKAEFAQVRKLLATNRNFWREYLAKWNITNVTPYIAGARPDPALIAREDAERKARLDEETERLRKAYGVADRQEALERFAAEADAELARIEKATHVPPTPFVKSPPLTLDDDLRYEEVKLANGVPLAYSRFDNMTGAFTGIALRLDGVPRDELRYVSLLPQLLAAAGVVENGRPVSYEEMRERQRKEILELRPSFSANTRTGRTELVLRGSGIGVEESRRARLDGARALQSRLAAREPRAHPRRGRPGARRPAQHHAAARGVLGERPGERVPDERHPAFLAADSFLTRTHNALRLRWLLKDAAARDSEAVGAFLSKLAETGRGMTRAELKALLAPGKASGLDALTPAQRALADEARFVISTSR